MGNRSQLVITSKTGKVERESNGHLPSIWMALFDPKGGPSTAKDATMRLTAVLNMLGTCESSEWDNVPISYLKREASSILRDLRSADSVGLYNGEWYWYGPVHSTWAAEAPRLWAEFILHCPYHLDTLTLFDRIYVYERIRRWTGTRTTCPICGAEEWTCDLIGGQCLACCEKEEMAERG